MLYELVDVASGAGAGFAGVDYDMLHIPMLAHLAALLLYLIHSGSAI
jgi:hypothetical protein